MPRLRPMLAVAFFVAVSACGGDGSTTNPDNGTPPGGTTTGARTLTATYNGVAFKPTILTSAYISNVAAVNAADGKHSLAINIAKVTGPGTFSVAPGGPNSGIAQWIDDTGSFSSLDLGGSGTVTLTIVQLGRVAGSFNFIAKTTLNPQAAGVAVVGTFDIKFP
jgi:hypothetical protein